jgi:hypothetical protein
MPDLIHSAIKQITQKKMITNFFYIEMMDSERLLTIAEENSLILTKSSRNGSALCALFQIEHLNYAKN